MEGGLDTQTIVVIAGCVLVWTLVSGRAARFNITAPMAFVAMGAVLANGPSAIAHVDISSSSVRGLVEITLAIILFADASRLHLGALRGDAGLPVRLLLIGLPVMIGLGMLVGIVLFPDLDLWVVALIAAAVAPTDAALGAEVVEDRRVPARVRRALNVESGLNDGIATPIVTFCIAGAVAEASSSGITVASALRELGIGAVGGIAVGGIGGLLLVHARRRAWAAPSFVPIGILALAIGAYAGSIEADGNGFVAAFVAGMAFGAVARRDMGPSSEFVAAAGELLSIVVWFVFGALMAPVVRDASWHDLVYAIASLTMIRMASVGVALIGGGLDARTVLFIGWFGPRGLASVVFALLAFDALDPADAHAALSAIAVTVVLSVVAHGLSAGPLAVRYGARAKARGVPMDAPPHVAEIPARSFVRRGAHPMPSPPEHRPDG